MIIFIIDQFADYFFKGINCCFHYQYNHVLNNCEYPHKSDFKKLSTLLIHSPLLVFLSILNCHKGKPTFRWSFQNNKHVTLAKGSACLLGPRQKILNQI